jgi:hypothetical protein
MIRISEINIENGGFLTYFGLKTTSNAFYNHLQIIYDIKYIKRFHDVITQLFVVLYSFFPKVQTFAQIVIIAGVLRL